MMRLYGVGMRNRGEQRGDYDMAKGRSDFAVFAKVAGQGQQG